MKQQRFSSDAASWKGHAPFQVFATQPRQQVGFQTVLMCPLFLYYFLSLEKILHSHWLETSGRPCWQAPPLLPSIQQIKFLFFLQTQHCILHLCVLFCPVRMMMMVIVIFFLLFLNFIRPGSFLLWLELTLFDFRRTNPIVENLFFYNIKRKLWHWYWYCHFFSLLFQDLEKIKRKKRRKKKTFSSLPLG